MTIEIKILDELDELGEIFDKKMERIIVKSLKQATRDGLKPLEKEMIEEIRKEYSLPKGEIKKDYFKKFYTKRARSIHKIFGEIKVRRKPVNMLRLVIGPKTPTVTKGIKADKGFKRPNAPTYKKRKPVRVKLKPGRIKKDRSLFIAKGRNSNMLVFRKKYEAGKGKAKWYKQSLPSLHKVFESQAVRDRINKKVGPLYVGFYVKRFRANVQKLKR